MYAIILQENKWSALHRMQASPAMNLSPVNVRRVVLGSAGAKKLPSNAQHFVTVKGSAK